MAVWPQYPVSTDAAVMGPHIIAQPLYVIIQALYAIMQALNVIRQALYVIVQELYATMQALHLMTFRCGRSTRSRRTRP